MHLKTVKLINGLKICTHITKGIPIKDNPPLFHNRHLINHFLTLNLCTNKKNTQSTKRQYYGDPSEGQSAKKLTLDLPLHNSPSTKCISQGHTSTSPKINLSTKNITMREKK